MNPFDDLLRHRWLRSVLLFVACASAIWMTGPYLGVGPVRPLTGGAARAAVIVALAAFWGAALYWRERKAATPAAPSGAKVLRARFNHALGVMRRRRLMHRPWYLVIGPPGAGKGAWLTRAGFEASITPWRAVAGDEVRDGPSFDLWTDGKAVMFDAEGALVDGGEAWETLLRLLRRRGRERLAGVVLAANLADLVADDGSGPDRAQPLRKRLDDVAGALGVLPTYLVLTHADRIAGFTEWFEVVDDAARAQVWGATFGESTHADGRAAFRVDRAYGRLTDRLERQLLHRMHSLRDPSRRLRLFTFTQQLRLYRPGVRRFVDVVFGARVQGEPPMLRGFYLVSSTQDGREVDTVATSFDRRHGLHRAPPPSVRRPRRSYFGHALVRDLMIPESGLARSRKGPWRRWRPVVALACAAVLAGIVVWAMVDSHRRNAMLVGRVDSALEAWPTSGQAAHDSLRRYYGHALGRLDTLGRAERELAPILRDRPFRMGLGLFQGDALASMLKDARLREMTDGVLPGLAAQFRAAMDGRDPGRLYLALKGHLMLAEPERRDDDALRHLARERWREAFDGDDALVAVFDRHLAALLVERPVLAAFPRDEPRVDAARSLLRAADVSALIYAGLATGAEGDTIRLDRALGLLAGVFRRKDGEPLSSPLPTLYTRKGFAWMMGEGDRPGAIDGAVARFAGEAWVLGERAEGGERAAWAAAIRRRYAADYVAAWEALLANLEWEPVPDATRAALLAARLGGTGSPLKALLLLLREHTVGLTGNTESDVRTATASAIAERFAPLTRLLDGDPGRMPLDPLLASLDALGRQSIAPAVEGAGPVPAAGALDALHVEAARLPPPLSAWIAGLADAHRATGRRLAGDALRTALREAAGTDCEALVRGRYPFSPDGAEDVPLNDFARLFGRGGRMDVYFKEHLAAIVDTSRPAWRYREPDVGAGDETLAVARAAADVREAWFAGGERPSVEFTLSIPDLPPGIGRVTVDVDGQVYERRIGGGTPVPMRMRWPGPMPGRTTVSAWDGEGHALPVLEFPGDWGWFRALDAAQLDRRTETRFDATFETAGRAVRIDIEAGSLRHPFADTSAQRFRCPA